MTVESGQKITTTKEIWIWSAEDVQITKGQMIDMDQFTDNCEKIAEEGASFTIISAESDTVRVQDDETGFETYFAKEELDDKFSQTEVV